MFVHESGDSENAYVCHLSNSGGYLCAFVVVHHRLCVYSPRYNSEGRVTNITLPTGEVSGFHGNLELSVRGHHTLQRAGHVAMVTSSFTQTLLQATCLQRHIEGIGYYR